MADKFLNLTGLSYFWSKITSALNLKADKTELPSEATDNDLGLVKTNSTQNITLNSSGQLEVGGRLGQTVDLGLYNPVFADPVKVGRFSLLMSEAKGLSAAHRELIIAGGNGLTLKTTAQAGATEYRVSNTQQNRFVCSCFVGTGSVLTIDEAYAKEKTVPIVSCKFANGNDVTAYFGATESNNDIIITTSESINPDSTISNIRCYGSWGNADTVSVGQGNRSEGGKILQVGAALYVAPNNNQVLQLGNRQYSTKNNVIMIGNDLISKKQFWALFGQGHDNSLAADGGLACGLWSNITANTKLVVGNGTAYNARSNLLELLNDGRLKISGTPTEDDDVATKKYVDDNAGGGGSPTVTTYGNADFTYEKVLDPDTQEVINECVAYSTSSGNANEPTATKYGRVVNLAGAFKNINARPDNSAFDMGKVPVGCEPLKTQYILSQGTSQYKFMLTIKTDGTINCSRYSASTSAIAVPNNAWLNINATYVSAS